MGSSSVSRAWWALHPQPRAGGRQAHDRLNEKVLGSQLCGD